MNTITINHADRLKGEVSVPGDKSISHRGIMFGSLSEGITEITNFLEGADCLSTIDCFQKMGVDIQRDGDRVTIHGSGLHGLKAPSTMLDVGNSGTTTRLMSGILAGQSFPVSLTGDESIQTRPMARIISPLSEMGASIECLSKKDCVPFTVHGGSLRAIDYISPVASAQVKSCVLLAGLYADGITSVTEPALSRNHTELMLNGFGAEVISKGLKASIKPEPKLLGQKLIVPGDISSAAYFIAAGLIVPGSEVLIKNVGVNPTRDGILKVAEAMGANITRLNEHLASGEPVCDLLVRHSELHATTIEGDIIPALIDEIPVIAVMAAFADGTTVIKDAAELKVKESNRIDTVTENLRAMGADITPTDDGMIINGGNLLRGAVINSHLDHRIAMAFTVAALAAEGSSNIIDGNCVNISYPDFYSDIKMLTTN